MWRCSSRRKILHFMVLRHKVVWGHIFGWLEFHLPYSGIAFFCWSFTDQGTKYLSNKLMYWLTKIDERKYTEIIWKDQTKMLLQDEVLFKIGWTKLREEQKFFSEGSLKVLLVMKVKRKTFHQLRTEFVSCRFKGAYATAQPLPLTKVYCLCTQNHIGPKECKKNMKTKCVTFKITLHALKKQDLNYMKCVSRVIELMWILQADRQDFWTIVSVRRLCWKVVSWYVLPVVISWYLLHLQFEQDRRFSRFFRVRITTSVNVYFWERTVFELSPPDCIRLRLCTYIVFFAVKIVGKVRR